MNLLSVNCRGCGQDAAVQELHQLVEEKKPAMVFLMETRMGEDRAMGLQRRLGFANSCIVKSDGQSGGLMLLWRGDVTVCELSKSKSHVDVILSCDRMRTTEWRFTGFYGEPRRERRKESWYLMRFLRAQSALPWLCVGDFNEVLLPEEHIGGRGRESRQMDAFQAAVDECRLTDLGYQGLPYTCDNKQEDGRNVKARLDRAFGDDKFLRVMGDTKVAHVQLAKSDHAALTLEIKEAEGNRRRKPKPFRYENMWQTHGEYKEFVERVWDSGDGADLTQVVGALKSLQGSLRSWDREVFGSVKQQVTQLRGDLEAERSSNLYRGPTTREKAILAKLSDVLEREEIMERQRSRISWLKEGDRNTEFFQAKARARGRVNRIKSLIDEDGRILTEQEDLERLACQFYQDLFSAQHELQPELVCKFVDRRLTPEMAQELMKPFTEQEVEQALFQMAPSKAPGVDGFNADFFQAHWPLVKESVVMAVLGFLNGGDMPEGVNKTLLVLIPKVAHPQELSQFRPISLCNVLYKI